MKKPTVEEALIYLMVITSASDRDMTDIELERIGLVVTTWPVFQDFDNARLIAVAQDCHKRLHAPEGVEGVFAQVRHTVPARLADTAYAAAVEVASADMEMRLEERRVIHRLRALLDIEPAIATGIEHAAKARHRFLN